MLKKDLILRSPVSKTLGIENVKDGHFGAVVSRAGVGKTSFLVQIAITQLLKNEKILHISLVESIEKINFRYSDCYTNLIDSIGYVDPQKAQKLWEEIAPNKVCISYNESTFDTEKIREYLKSFKKADLILPSIIIMDGLNFDKDVSGILEKLEILSREFSIFIWFSIKSHREQQLCADGYPIQLETYKNMFDKAVFLNAVSDKIDAIILKDGAKTDQCYKLDSSTLMVIGED